MTNSGTSYTNSSFLKTSVDGTNGSGKTCTIAQLALGLSKEYRGGCPVHVFDSSDRWSAWKVKMFDVEKIPLVITYGRSIAVLQDAILRAADLEKVIFVGDDLTVPWLEGVEAFSYENGAMPFERRQQLMNEWNEFVEPFQCGDFDALACGRLGFRWEKVEDENGEEQIKQGDSKFNAGGSQNFAYDAVLELEMRRRVRRLLGLIRGRTIVEYVCDVIKDANDVLNLKQFVFSPFPDGYQKGDYKKVLDSLRPHIEFRNSLPRQPFQYVSSRNLIKGGETAWSRDQAEHRKHLETIQGLWDYCYGSQQSTLGRMFRNLSLETWGFQWSWSDFEKTASTEKLAECVAIMQAVRRRIENKETPTDHKSLEILLQLATDEVHQPSGRYISLMEAMGIESLKKPRKAQPIVAAMDKTDRGEILAGD